jgi:hypothetical protein
LLGEDPQYSVNLRRLLRRLEGLRREQVVIALLRMWVVRVESVWCVNVMMVLRNLEDDWVGG